MDQTDDGGQTDDGVVVLRQQMKGGTNVRGKNAATLRTRNMLAGNELAGIHHHLAVTRWMFGHKARQPYAVSGRKS
jgi:hypothetical protein